MLPNPHSPHVPHAPQFYGFMTLNWSFYTTDIFLRTIQDIRRRKIKKIEAYLPHQSWTWEIQKIFQEIRKSDLF